MEVSIFININHKGHKRTGTGTYAIILQYIKGNKEPETREYFKGLEKTSENRTALTACIEALEYLIKPCDVKLIIDNQYITQIMINEYFRKWDCRTWTKNKKPIKNPDLWVKILQQIAKHQVTFEFKETNEYTSYFEMMLKRVNIEYKEDKHGETI